MAEPTDPEALLIFSGTGPILLLSSYPSATDERLAEKLSYKGINKYLAYQVSSEAARERYADSYERVAGDLAGREDARVLDYNGHQIMANFSLSELGEPIKVGD